MANEKRLIAYDAVYQYAFDCVHGGGMEHEDFDAIINAIDAVPTIDAVEVVHGRWEDEHGGKYANPRYRCPVCKGRALYKFEQDLLGSWKGVQALTDFCPNCGAKMDGDGNG